MSKDALVVGINTYQYSGLANLQAPAKDAEAIAQRLEQDGEFNVWRLPEAISRETHHPFVGETLGVKLLELKQALVKLFLPEGKSIPDTALFYFSGHGLRTTWGPPEGFLATSDVNPNIEFNGLSLKWLRELLRESPIKQQIVWLDCCHSGELLNFKQEADPGEQGQGRDRCFIAASREFEVSYEEIGSLYSVLTKVLLQGLDPSRCPQRWVTNYSLVDYINQHLQGATQRPTFTNFGEPINLTRTCEVPQQQTTSEPTQAICPYKGLLYFDCNDEDPKYFYGREKLTAQLINKVRQESFLTIIGASGSGKSSVLRAGLLHQVKLGREIPGSDQWKIHLFTPGERPLHNLALAFVDPELSNIERATQLCKVEKLIEEGATGLRQLIQASTKTRVVLVVDQFEEVFTPYLDSRKREQFFQCLLGALAQTDKKLCLILAMRADFFGKCLEQEYSGLANQIQQHLVTVTPMNREELREAIVEPAKRVNLAIELELVKQMLDDVENAPGRLPLLQYTLRELWKNTKGYLQLKTYIQLGGVTGTLEARATKVYKEFSEEEQSTTQYIFLALTQPGEGEGTEDTRRRVLKRDLVTSKHSEAEIDAVLQKLVDEKLVVTSELREKGLASGHVTVIDVAHEALIRHWSLLHSWINENRNCLKQRHKIEGAAKEWEFQKKSQGYLLQGKQLADAETFRQQQNDCLSLSQLAESFIQQSIQHRRNNYLKLVVFGLIMPLSLAIFVGVEIKEYLRLKPFWEIIQQPSEKVKSSDLKKALEEVNKAGHSLNDREFPKADLREIKLRKAKLRNTNLNGVKLSDADLSDSDLSDADLSNTKLINVTLIETDLSNARLIEANLRSADLSKAKLIEAKLHSADLHSADFSNANLSNADLRKASLIDANFSNADLSNADLNGATLWNTNFCNTTMPDGIVNKKDCPE